MSTLVSPESIAEAGAGLRGIAVRTPLLPAPWLSEAVEAAGHGPGAEQANAAAPADSAALRLPRGDIRLKCECLQHAGAFKLRGAYTMVARLSEADRRRGIITYSSGNHAQAVALTARIFGIPAVVVMPTTAPAVKVEGARRLGADVVFEG
ncbi:MAG TPA: pyridoxal-phosphate dependent enzyme, partial [Longimicrobiales bacterium]